MSFSLLGVCFPLGRAYFSVVVGGLLITEHRPNDSEVGPSQTASSML